KRRGVLEKPATSNGTRHVRRIVLSRVILPLVARRLVTAPATSDASWAATSVGDGSSRPTNTCSRAVVERSRERLPLADPALRIRRCQRKRPLFLGGLGHRPEELDNRKHDHRDKAAENEARRRNREPLERLLGRIGASEARCGARRQHPENRVAEAARAERDGDATANGVVRPAEPRKEQNAAQRDRTDRAPMQVGALVVRPTLVDHALGLRRVSRVNGVQYRRGAIREALLHRILERAERAAERKTEQDRQKSKHHAPTRNAQSLREVLRPHGRDLSCASFDRNETCDLHRVSSLLTPWPARCRKSMAAAIPILARDAGKERATTSARSSGLENGFAIRAS